MATDDAADSGTDAGEDATVTYQFECPEEPWRPWTNTIPRAVPIAERLRTLIRQDLEAHRRATGGHADAEKDSAVLATRIRIRATQAEAALRESDGVDAETAREQLADIRQLAEALES